MKRVIVGEERQSRKSGGSRLVYIVKCETEGCDSLLKVRSGDINSEKQTRCLKCQNRKRPYESSYNSFCRAAENTGHNVSITYDEFLGYMSIDRCEYCGVKVERNPYPVINGKFSTRAPHLDRRDSSRGYESGNISVCCFDCNRAKSNIFSYETWMDMTKKLREGVTLPKNIGDRYYILFGLVVASGNE